MLLETRIMQTIIYIYHDDTYLVNLNFFLPHSLTGKCNTKYIIIFPAYMVLIPYMCSMNECVKGFFVTVYAGHCSASITKWREHALCGTFATVTLTFESSGVYFCPLEAR